MFTTTSSNVQLPLCRKSALIRLAKLLLWGLGTAANGAGSGPAHPTFIGVCAKAGAVVSTSFTNPDMTFKIQGDARLTDKTIIGSALFTTWAAGTSAAVDIVLTFISVDRRNAPGGSLRCGLLRERIGHCVRRSRRGRKSAGQ